MSGRLCTPVTVLIVMTICFVKCRPFCGACLFARAPIPAKTLAKEPLPPFFELSRASWPLTHSTCQICYLASVPLVASVMWGGQAKPASTALTWSWVIANGGMSWSYLSATLSYVLWNKLFLVSSRRIYCEIKHDNIGCVRNTKRCRGLWREVFESAEKRSVRCHNTTNEPHMCYQRDIRRKVGITFLSGENVKR